MSAKGYARGRFVEVARLSPPARTEEETVRWLAELQRKAKGSRGMGPWSLDLAGTELGPQTLSALGALGAVGAVQEIDLSNCGKGAIEALGMVQAGVQSVIMRSSNVDIAKLRLLGLGRVHSLILENFG